MESLDDVERAVERIDARYLASIQTDEEQGIVLGVERVRLVLYGSLAMIAAAATAFGSMETPPSPWLVGGGIALLQAAALVAWNGLTHAETLRSERVTRKHIERAGMLHARLGDRGGLFPDPGSVAMDEARADERATRHRIIERTHWGAALAGFGFVLLFGAFIQVIDGRGSSPDAMPEQLPPSTVAPVPLEASAG